MPPIQEQSGEHHGMTTEPMSPGYLSRAYAKALSDHGTPHYLSASGGWLIERPIADTSFSDAMGTYPLLVCCDWTALAADLDAIGSRLVSVVCVTDPFADRDEQTLTRAFPDLLMRYKEHFIVDLGPDRESHVHPNHRRKARRALGDVEISVADPGEAQDTWISLYGNLVARHAIQGIAAFSAQSLCRQLEVPGATLLVARHDGEIVGATLWYRHDDVAYYHLGAYSERGYALQASFAVFWQAMGYFAERGVSALDIGAAAGVSQTVDDGLTRFKRGWANRTLPVFLGGRILDPAAYRRLAERSGGATGFFPAYRASGAG